MVPSFLPGRLSTKHWASVTCLEMINRTCRKGTVAVRGGQKGRERGGCFCNIRNEAL